MLNFLQSAGQGGGETIVKKETVRGQVSAAASAR